MFFRYYNCPFKTVEKVNCRCCITRNLTTGHIEKSKRKANREHKEHDVDLDELLRYKFMHTMLQICKRCKTKTPSEVYAEAAVK